MLIQINQTLNVEQIEQVKKMLDDMLLCDHSVYYDSLQNKIILEND